MPLGRNAPLQTCTRKNYTRSVYSVSEQTVGGGCEYITWPLYQQDGSMSVLQTDLRRVMQHLLLFMMKVWKQESLELKCSSLIHTVSSSYLWWDSLFCKIKTEAVASSSWAKTKSFVGPRYGDGSRSFLPHEHRAEQTVDSRAGTASACSGLC